jgi:hypothetical protein
MQIVGIISASITTFHTSVAGSTWRALAISLTAISFFSTSAIACHGAGFNHTISLRGVSGGIQALAIDKRDDKRDIAMRATHPLGSSAA